MGHRQSRLARPRTAKSRASRMPLASVKLVKANNHSALLHPRLEAAGILAIEDGGVFDWSCHNKYVSKLSIRVQRYNFFVNYYTSWRIIVKNGGRKCCVLSSLPVETVPAQPLLPSCHILCWVFAVSSSGFLSQPLNRCPRHRFADIGDIDQPTSRTSILRVWKRVRRGIVVKLKTNTSSRTHVNS